jgi:hypothetical protein
MRLQTLFRRKQLIHYFPVYGSISTALIYVSVGVIALLSFFKVRNGGADESSFLAIMNDYIVGKVFIIIVLSGLLCYVIWRFYEAITDPYSYGRSFSGIAKRVGICVSTTVDMMIAMTAVRVLLGRHHIMLNGQPREEQEMVGSMLDNSWGPAFLILFGSVVLIVAVSQFWYGITRGYKERIDLEHFVKPVQTVTHGLAWFGYFARGVILGIIGFFLVKSAASNDPTVVVNTDKAFDFIGDHIGHFYFIAIAIGTICYGLFMTMLGVAYDIDKD